MGDIVHNVGSSTSAIRPANKPVITVDSGDITLETGAELVIPDADVKNWNNKVVPHTIDTSAVDMSTEGTYPITYTAVDMLGRTTIESRNVVVETPLIPAHYYMVAQVGSGVFVKFRFEQDFADYANLSTVDTVQSLRSSQAGSIEKQWGTIGTILVYTQSSDSSERRVSHLLQFTADQVGVSAELQTSGAEGNWIYTASNNLVDGGTPLTHVPEGPA